MADYYPLVAKAVAGLEKNTGEGRRALYERARTALVAQLRGMNDPPLTEAEITRERLALAEATAQGAKTAREVFAATPPSTNQAFDRLEPRIEPEGFRTPLRTPSRPSESPRVEPRVPEQRIDEPPWPPPPPPPDRRTEQR